MWAERVDLGSFEGVWKAEVARVVQVYRPAVRTLRHDVQPFQFVYAECCRKKRWAAYCDVIGGGWYAPQFYCQPTHGCRTKKPW